MKFEILSVSSQSKLQHICIIIIYSKFNSFTTVQSSSKTQKHKKYNNSKLKKALGSSFSELNSNL